MNRRQIVDVTGHPHLALELLHGAIEYADQRTWPEPLGDVGHVLHALCTTEHANEGSALRAGTGELTPLRENHAPGNHAESEQQEDDKFRNRAGLKDKIDDFAADQQ